MPHFSEAWCSGVDFLYSIDYEGMVDRGDIHAQADVATLQVSAQAALCTRKPPSAPTPLSCCTRSPHSLRCHVRLRVPPPRMARLLTKKEIEKLQSLGAQQMDVEARNMLLGFG